MLRAQLESLVVNLSETSQGGSLDFFLVVYCCLGTGEKELKLCLAGFRFCEVSRIQSQRIMYVCKV